MQSVKSMISRVAEQVSQVPLILKIRCESIKGTGLLRMRAPPTDRMWFSFKEMPELDLVPEPCIGERRFNSGPLGTFIVQHLKVSQNSSLPSVWLQHRRKQLLLLCIGMHRIN
jgi:hypothetical protein